MKLYLKYNILHNYHRLIKKTVKALNILIVTDKIFYKFNGRFYTDGGTPNQIKYLLSKVNVDILPYIIHSKSIPENMNSVDEKLNVHETDKFKPYFHSLPPIINILQSIKLTKEICNHNNFDIIIGKGPREIGMSAVIAAKQLGIPSIFHYSYDWFDFPPVSSSSYAKNIALNIYYKAINLYKSMFFSYVCNSATAIGTVSEKFISNVSEQMNISPDKIKLMPQAFSLDESYREIAPLDDNTPNNIYYVGRLDRNKNVTTLIEAFSIILNKKDLNLKLVIIGDGPSMSDVKSSIEKYNLEKHVEVKGFVQPSKIKGLLAEALLLVLPSFSEALGKTLIEAMGAGRPVIGSNVGGIPEVIEDNISGFLIDPHSAEDIAEKISFLVNDRSLAIKMGNVAKISSQKFMPDNSLKCWVNSINEVSSTKF